MKWLYVFALCVVLAASENPEENLGVVDRNLSEGDMILTADQRIDDSLGRGAIINRQWPNGEMFYVIDSRLSGNSKAMTAIRAAMEEWTSKTCIRFKKRTSETAYAYFKYADRGCSSYVGRTGRRQDIKLASGCWYKGIVAHEIGHALGFYHEQSRPDRDDYVTIVWGNIKQSHEHNFKLKHGKINSLGSKYDYGSLMHYKATSFSKNGQPTIVAKKSGVILGQRRGISSEDAKQMNLLYKSHCRGSGGGGGGNGGGGGGGGGGSNCKDKSNGCKGFEKYCELHPYKDWMKTNCMKTCKHC